MTRSIFSRRLFLSGAAGAALALSGCSAGINAQTADQVAAVPGGNAEATVVPGPGSVAVRDAMFSYTTPKGYKSGELAPLQVRIFNDTQSSVQVTIEGAEPAKPIDIAPAGYAVVDKTVKVKLLKDLLPGFTVPVTFTFSNGAVITLEVPVATPLAPAQRTPIEVHEPTDTGGGAGH